MSRPLCSPGRPSDRSRALTPLYQTRSIAPAPRDKAQRDLLFRQLITRSDAELRGTEDAGHDDEVLDPRVQTELDSLNACAEDINQLENALEEANGLFRALLSDSTRQLKALSKKIGGSAIDGARPYFEALETCNAAQKECRTAASAFQRATGIYSAAKETIALAEQRFLSNSTEWEFDNAWQEMLSHATIKVMAAEKQRTECEAEYLKWAATFTSAEQEVQRLEKKLKKYIVKTKVYFDQKENLNKALEAQKKRVQDLQMRISKIKNQYSRSLQNLEEISESIHARRKLRQLWAHEIPTWTHRDQGVGAELDYDLDECDRGSSRSSSSEKSSNPTSSDRDSLENLPTESDEFDLHSKFGTLTLAQRSTAPISRTSSCPAKDTDDVFVNNYGKSLGCQPFEGMENLNHSVEDASQKSL